MKKFAFLLIAMATALALVPASVSNAQVICPNAAGFVYSDGTKSYVPGPLDSTCGTNSAVHVTIPTNQDDASVYWSAATTGLTLGTLNSLNASVSFSAQSPGDQPYFVLDFHDYGSVFGEPSGDTILMLEFQANNLSGNNMLMNSGTTLFNLYDNTTGTYLLDGQTDAHSLSYWLSLYPALSGDGMWTGIEMGNAGGCDGACAESLTINSLDVNPPVSAPESSSLPMFFLSGLVLFGAIFLKARKSDSFMTA